jgi:crotonobetainyl-CoA:carnitine CoA-transferase CaiB-like acyl-CoA transferase
MATVQRRNTSAGPTAPPPGASLPLEGVRVLDFTVVWAGPYSTMQLADWGAEVIRVESRQHFAPQTRGLMARPPQAMAEASANQGGGYPDDLVGEHAFNRAPFFNDHARNKLSMTVNLGTPEGQAVLDRLIAESDGLIENNLPPNIEKQGITWERVSKVNPQLIMLRVPAFGLDGPYRGYRTWGNHMEALIGHPVLRAYPHLGLDYAPTGVPSDAASGIGSALAFMMGLRQRRKTGEGLMIEVATAENFVPFIGEFVMDYTMNGRVHQQLGNTHPTLAPHNVYRCWGSDRWVAIAVRSEEEWRRFCTVAHPLDLEADPRFGSMATRHEYRDALDRRIAEWTIARDAYWVMERLQAEGIAAGVVMNERDALESRHLAARGFWHPLSHPETGTQRYAGTPWQTTGPSPEEPRRYPVRLGEDNAYVYKQVLGFTDGEYAELEQAGHIGMDYDPSVA